MSREETFFNPRAMARVVEHVEWPEQEIVYKDGSSNQSQYVRAMAMLYERWMRDWTLPDVEASFRNVCAGNYVDEYRHIMEAWDTRIRQVYAWFEGLWYGANPRQFRPLLRWYAPDLGNESSADRWLEVTHLFFGRLSDMLRPRIIEEEGGTTDG